MSKAYIIGTCDTKGPELSFMRDLIESAGVATCLVDVSTTLNDELLNANIKIDILAREVAAYHPDGVAAISSLSDRGQAVAAMKIALVNFVSSKASAGEILGVVGAGGSGNTDLVSAALRVLPIGMPKIFVSTVGSGDVSPYVGPSDIAMVYSVTDVAGLNQISRQVLGNAANALVGMLCNPVPASEDQPAIGLSMFGVTTPCVERVRELLQDDYECLVFHATGTGGQSMEKLVESGFLTGTIDVTTTEVCDEISGGVFSAGPHRFDILAASGHPYVGSCGALDMVNFGAMTTVPERYKDRKLYAHNANVTLMRTNVEESIAIGRFIGEKLNAFRGKVRFLLPEKGLSLLDMAGEIFYEPQANAALFKSLKDTVIQTEIRKIVTLPFHLNDDNFAQALFDNWNEIKEGIV